MKIITVIIAAIPLLSLLTVGTVQAFNLDKLIIVANSKGNGIVTLENDSQQSIFVKAQVQEIKIDGNNNIIRTEYNRSNLNDWKISLTHSKFVLKSNEKKDIGIRSLCHNRSCDDSKDLMFMLPFTPSKYESEIKSGIEINYGFTPIYIIPTRYPVYNYEIYNKGESLRINNHSNTMINVLIDTCKNDNNINCKKKFTVISGRDKTFKLPKKMQSTSISATVYSFDKKYYNQVTVDKYNFITRYN